VTPTTTVDAYERVTIPTEGKANTVFLYVAHFYGSNHLVIGAGSESASRLQRSHLPGPMVHQDHIDALIAWAGQGRIEFREETGRERVHAFTSTMNVDLPARLEQTDLMTLSIGKFLPLLASAEVPQAVVQQLAIAISRVRIKVFGHPADWDVRFCELNDGRFVWMAYDLDLDKIRIGMGFHDEANQKQFGVHAYAVGKRDAATYGVHHHHNTEIAIQFVGLPPRWPQALNPFLHGEPKARFAVEFIRLADEVWPGEVALPED
jgi:hypothetical protein